MSNKEINKKIKNLNLQDGDGVIIMRTRNNHIRIILHNAKTDEVCGFSKRLEVMVTELIMKELKNE